MFLPLKNKAVRPGIPLRSVKAIVMHSPAVSNQTAHAVYNYFEGLKADEHVGSYHDIIDLDGSVYNLIPYTEVAWHTGSTTPDPKSHLVYTDICRSLQLGEPNFTTLGVCMCEGDNHVISELVEEVAVKHVVTLLKSYNLSIDNLVRHHDVVGWKDCPIYYCKSDNWDHFLHLVDVNWGSL